MHSSRKLKIWTIILHFFIPFGVGHGAICLGILEILLLPGFIHAGSAFSVNASFGYSLPAFGLCSIFGQIALITSILVASKKNKILLHIAGLILLWIGIYFVVHEADAIHSIAFSLYASIPFFICTLLPFLISPVRKLYHWTLS